MNPRILQPFLSVAAVAAICTSFTASTAQSSSGETVNDPARTVLFFHSPGGPSAVYRDTASLAGSSRSGYTSSRELDLEKVARALVAGPTPEEQANGLTTALPQGSALGRVNVISAEFVEIGLDLPPGFVASPAFSPQFVEDVADMFVKSLGEKGARTVVLQAKDPATGGYRLLSDFLPRTPDPGREPDNAASELAPPPQTGPAIEAAPGPPVNPGTISGALSGKAVVLGQSHGWLDDHLTQNRWRVQRTRSCEQLEDYSSGEFVNHFVVPMLLNCGARVQPVRECDTQTNMAIVDNADGAPAYSETGSWLTSAAANGFAKKTQWTGCYDNPFGNADSVRYASGTTGAPNATATYVPDIPASGYYNVYISYASGSNRTPRAHWQVHHTGGVSDYYVNEMIDGSTWNLLGNFYFDAGTSPSAGKVMLLNDSPDGGVVSCDAVRFGGGMGDIARRSHGLSGRPRWQEGAANYLQYTGMLASPLMYDDDTTGSNDETLGKVDRPEYARWEQTRDGEGDNVIYVSWHTNAYNGGCDGSGNETYTTAHGTESFRDLDGSANTQSRNLASACHNALINAYRKFWDATWTDRTLKQSNGYPECLQANLGTVGGFFYEALFHDNEAEAGYYKSASMRYIMARAVAQGIIAYYGGTTFPPEIPVNFRVRDNGGGQALLTWASGPVRDGTYPYGSAATAYRVHRSSNGFGFDSGTTVTGTEYSLAIPPGEVAYFRVSAVNSAGISFPTETLAVRLPVPGNMRTLIVNGYHRYDRYLPNTVSEPGIGGCTNANPNTVRRIDPHTYQDFNYIMYHARALASANASFDSCSHECIEQGLVSLTGYPTVDWLGGQECEAYSVDPYDNTAIKPNSRTAIQNYLTAGGNLLMSNSELAWDFDRSGADPSKSSFLRNWLKASFADNDANTYQAQGAVGSIFAGLATFSFDAASGKAYDVSQPDVLNAIDGSMPCMSYVGGTGGTAAVQYSGAVGGGSPCKIVYIGFGLETISSDPIRNEVVKRVLNFFVAGPSRARDWRHY